jgi:hypothetical protein
MEKYNFIQNSKLQFIKKLKNYCFVFSSQCHLCEMSQDTTEVSFLNILTIKKTTLLLQDQK